jgi:hypothetical protein
MAFNPVRDVWANLRQLANNDVWQISDAGAPTSGTSGTGANFAGPGSMYTNITTGDKYVNTNTKASPTWSVLATGSFDPSAAIVATGTTTSGATTATSIVVSGALTTDIPIVTWKVAPQTTAHIIATVSVAGTIAVGFSATVGTAGTLQYALIRTQ